MTAPTEPARPGRPGWPGRRYRSDSPTPWLVLLPAPILGVAFTAWIGLGIDVKYALGGLQTAEAGGAGTVFDIFLHRPLAFRLLLDGLDGGRQLVTDDASSPLAQLVIRVQMCVLVAGAAGLLWWGLRRYVAENAARLTAVATGTALALASNFHFLTADWVGVVAALAAAGGALAPRRTVTAWTLGGLLLFLAVAVKIATAPWALLAACVVAFWSWRRAIGAASTGAVFGVVWLALTYWVDPIELAWLLDSIRAVSSSTSSHGATEYAALAKLLANISIVSPVLVVVPASIAALVAEFDRVTRLRYVLLLLGALGLACASGVGQGEGFAYQFAGLPVLAAGIWAFAVVKARHQTRWALLLTVALSGVSSAILLGAPVEWRRDVFGPVAAGYFSLAAIALVVVLATEGTRGRSQPPYSTLVSAASLSVTISFAAAGMPFSAYAFDGFDDHYTNIGLVRAEHEARVAYNQARGRIGSDTPVLYLTYGTRNYLLQNPTACRYPSPVFLARSTENAAVRRLHTYHDNLSCLDQPAGYLVVDRAWADPNKMESAVRQKIRDRFDCGQSFRITDGSTTVEFCPKRQ